MQNLTNNNFKSQILDAQRSLARLASDEFVARIEVAVSICQIALGKGLPMLVYGNGGSAADAQHIAGELVGQFLKSRQALKVRALSTDTSLITAWANDITYDTVFSRQV